MTTPSHLDTRTRTRPHLLLPDRHAGTDLVAVVLLGGLALTGLATSFTGWEFLVVGVLGVLAGTVVTHVTRALGWPLVSAVVVLLAAYWLLGGPLALRSRGDTAFLPGPDTLRGLADQAVFGWKDLLTTLPPVDGDGPLLVLPWLLGLATGLVGTALAHAAPRRAWVDAVLPVAGLSLVLVGVILLGVRHPQSLVLQGALFAAVALGWLVLRSRRAGSVVQGGSPGWVRAASGAGLVALAASLALPASALVTGADDGGRLVARTWVEPPFDIGRYPSPLAGFRRYVDLQGRRDPANVHDKTLFTITGVEPGTRVRLAALDRYDGMVWGASEDPLPGEDGDSFQRVSSTIDNPVAGTPVEATVTMGEGWSGVWLPTVGALQEIDFRTGDPLGKSETFRYNLATSTAVVPSGLHEGDTYSFAAVQPDTGLERSTLPAATVAPPPEGTSFLDGPVNQWAEGAGSTMAQVLAIAEHLRTHGKYSDGVVKDERQYHPGHGLRRLGDEFVSQQVMVGNDEQYAAVMALLAQKAGVPARVVLGAVVPDGGVVQGKDVSAWVELRAADGSWRTLPTEEFMSHEPPTQQLPQTNEPMTATVVPPPVPIPPPSDAGDLSDADLKQRKVAEEDEDEGDVLADAGLPGWLLTVVTWVGLPLLVVAAAAGAIVGAKAWRRHRRRSAASPSARFVGAWHELVDHARDLGHAVPLGAAVTRREQSRAIESERAGALARRADGVVFGPRTPEVAAAAAYWQDVDRERRALSQSVDRWRRWRAALSLTSLHRVRPRRPRGADSPSPAGSD